MIYEFVDNQEFLSKKPLILQKSIIATKQSNKNIVNL